MNQRRAFIETNNFPVALISQASAKEKQGGGRPDYWEMLFWWTRKPLASARGVAAGCLLPEDIDPRKFVRVLGLDQKAPHRYNPSIPQEWRQYFENKTLLDPFAGFGSIPLEAMRIGLSATAVELLPAAYVFLKAVLEYPSKYGEQLVKDLEKWGSWVTEHLRTDPVMELYEADVTGYVGTWEVKCPHCAEWTPLIGNFWLARIKDRKHGYERLAWLEPKKEHSKLMLSVVDFKKGSDLRDATVENNTVSIRNKTHNVPTQNISPRAQRATCLSCGGTVRFIDPATSKHYLEKKKLPTDVAERLQWYVKYALNKFNLGDSSIARQRLLVKLSVAEGEVRFESCGDGDQGRLRVARERLEAVTQETRQDIPSEQISPYSVRYLFPILYGINEWRKLFNPRQLLILVTIVRLIREAGHKIEKEMTAHFRTSLEAYKYAEAVTTYLSMALVRFVDHNNMATLLHPSNPMGIEIAHSLSMRGLAMQWNWGDTHPLSSAKGKLRANSWIKCVAKEIEGLRYLLSSVGTSSGSDTLTPRGQNSRPIEVLLDDATVLSKLQSTGKFDLIVTDPPYYDDVPYTELSDFYYVWLKRCLSDSEKGKLTPRFFKNAFFKEIDGEAIERRSQWEEFATREVSLNPPRLGKGTTFEDAAAYFQNLLDAAFQTMNSLLEEEGLLVTYYAHTDPEAWKALLKSGWEASGLAVSNAFPITTESAESVVKKGKLSLDTSIVVVWRRGASGSIQASRLYEQMIETSKARVDASIDMRIHGRDLFVAALAAALSEATQYKEIIEMKKLETSQLMDRYVLRAALYGLAKAISHRARVEEGIRTNEGLLYLVTKFLYSGSTTKIVTSDDARIFSFGTGVDLSHAVNSLKMFRAGSEKEEGEGASLAKRKALILLEPQSKDRLRLRDLLDYRGIDVENPGVRCSIDALHVLEYYALTYPREQFIEKFNDLKTKYPSEVDEALSLARIINGSLEGDIEKDLCLGVIEKAMPATKSIADFAGS